MKATSVLPVPGSSPAAPPGPWPDGKAFAFTILDDTDASTLANTKPIYDLLKDLGLRTTKSVWVLPSRGKWKGQTLSDPDYLAWVRDLQRDGFEIALHNVGEGRFSREEILDGLERYREWLGAYPRVHVNHANNPDNIYWMAERFQWPFNVLYSLYCRWVEGVDPRAYGSRPGSDCFWGDACKRHLDYIRNFTCANINTLAFDPAMPYEEPGKTEFSNRWFSSSDGHTVAEFCDLLRPEALARLRDERGACIVYTHFALGFVDARGQVRPEVRACLETLAAMDGWFPPVGPLLDHLKARQTSGSPRRRPSTLRWLADRVVKKLRYRR